MSISIQPIGSYFKLDENGFIINPTNHSLIPAYFKPILETVVPNYQRIYKNNLLSVFLRGSLARGVFVEGQSDIDFIGLIKDSEIKLEPVPGSQIINSDLKARFSLDSDFELLVSGRTDNIPEDYPALAMILKTQSLCISGIDFSKRLPKYKPGRELMINYKWLASDVKNFLSNSGNQIRENKSILKGIIRSGFELVLEREGQYTVDLYPSMVSFGKYYPEKRHYMEEILHFYLNPFEQIDRQKLLVSIFGNWLVEEFKNSLM